MQNNVQVTLLLEMMVFDKCIIYLELKLIVKDDFEAMVVSTCYLLNNPIFSRYRVLLLYIVFYLLSILLYLLKLVFIKIT